jgi:hypothetical protein
VSDLNALSWPAYYMVEHMHLYFDMDLMLHTRL